MNKNKIFNIIRFVSTHPESTASRRILRETIGEVPEKFNLQVINTLRHELEAAEELMIDGYYYLIK